jgi:hypothetical protein
MNESKPVYNANEPKKPQAMSDENKLFLIEGMRQSMMNAYHALVRSERPVYLACLHQAAGDLEFLLEQEESDENHNDGA